MAKQQATAISRYLSGLQDRLTAAANSADVTSAIAQPAEEQLREDLSARLLALFPDAVDLRVVALGSPSTAVLKGAVGLRTFIEADLLSRTGAEEETRPESYLHEEKWFTSIAVLADSEPDAPRVALLLTFENEKLRALLHSMSADQGSSLITQPYYLGNLAKERDIVTTPGKGINGLGADAVILGTTWRLRFAPSAEVVASFKPDTVPAYGLFGATGFLILMVLFMTYRANRRQLSRDVDLLAGKLVNKDPHWLPMPSLDPLVKRMRNRQVDQAGVDPSPDIEIELGDDENEAPPPKVDAAEFLTDPLFQNLDMLDAEGEEHPIDIDTSSPANIYRAYDIRGDAEQELRNHTIHKIARAIGSLCLEKNQSKVVVGADGRHSSPRIKTALINGLLECGCDVIDIGTVTTPLLSFATHTLGPNCGVMVTGSHNTSEVNGLKITVDGHVLCGADIQDLRHRAEAGDFKVGNGGLSTLDLLPTYRERIVRDIDLGVPLTLVVDAGNAVGGLIAPSVLEALGCAVIPLHCRLDPDFPNHDPDPSVDSNLKQLYDAVIKHDADLGIALDGDADRVTVLTGKGELVRPDRLLMLLAQDVLARNPGGKIVYDIKSSSNLSTVIKEAGGVPVLSRTGHAFMREQMLDTQAPVGAEFSGHIFFNERWFGFDDGIYAAARLIEILSNSEHSLSALLAEFPDSCNTPEILVPVADTAKAQIVSRLVDKANFPHGTLNTLDGLRVDFDDGWGLVRASNTSAALTMRFEAQSDASLIRIRKQFKDQLTAIVPELADKL
jgi:phosphomannomutase/phosphoglucomutase